MENPRIIPIHAKIQNTKDSMKNIPEILLLPLLPLASSLLPSSFLLLSSLRGSPNLGDQNELIFSSSLFYIIIFSLITSWSSISQVFEINLCYFYNGLSSSHIMPFISFSQNYNLTLVLVQHSKNTTMTLK